ncbi:MAG: histidine--tRNA ligase [bacterium]|nr:histidine--tRNA ligase [bacterium]
MEIITRLRGIKDILPDEIEKWKKIEQTFIEISELFGFKEIRIPIIENKFIFVKGIGTNTDIVMKEMYEFKDKKGREIALRPEGTASVVRAFIENKMYMKQKITKLYYYGPMFRYDRPQKGRYRQFYQFGVEIFGGKSPYFDAELINLLNIAFDKLGIREIIFLLNSLGCENCKDNYIKKIKGHLESNINKFCNDCKVRIEKNPLRIFDCKNISCKKTVEKLPSIIDFLCNECKEHFEKFIKLIEKFGIEYKIDPKLVRGIDYYTRTVFEVNFKNDEIAIAGGGRYDNLVRDMSGPDIPAVGFAVGIDRIVPLICDDKMIKNDVVFLVLLGENARKKSFEIMKNLIENKIKFETDYEDRSLSEYLRVVNKTGIRWCMILGDNEIEKGVVILKDMQTGKQELIENNEIVNKIKERIKC